MSKFQEHGFIIQHIIGNARFPTKLVFNQTDEWDIEAYYDQEEKKLPYFFQSSPREFNHE